MDDKKYMEMLKRLYPQGKTLYLREMGMDDQNIPGDIKNHRIRVIERIDIAYKRRVIRNFFFEFTAVNPRYTYRTTNKITGKPLKHAVKEIANINGIGIDTQFEIEEIYSQHDKHVFQASYRHGEMEKELYAANYSYTRADILRIINLFALENYNNIVLVEEKTREIINDIGGNREKEIINNDPYFEISETWNNEHKIIRVVERVKTEYAPRCYKYEKGRACEVDLITGKITN